MRVRGEGEGEGEGVWSYGCGAGRGLLCVTLAGWAKRARLIKSIQDESSPRGAVECSQVKPGQARSCEVNPSHLGWLGLGLGLGLGLSHLGWMGKEGEATDAAAASVERPEPRVAVGGAGGHGETLAERPVNSHTRHPSG